MQNKKSKSTRKNRVDFFYNVNKNKKHTIWCALKMLIKNRTKEN